MVERTIVSAFHRKENNLNNLGYSSNWEDLLLLLQKEPRVKIGLLSKNKKYLLRAFDIAAHYPLYSIHPNIDMLMQEGIERITGIAHALPSRVKMIPYERRVAGWQARKKDDARIALIKKCCDGIITNHVEFFVP